MTQIFSHEISNLSSTIFVRLVDNNKALPPPPPTKEGVVFGGLCWGMLSIDGLSSLYAG